MFGFGLATASGRLSAAAALDKSGAVDKEYCPDGLLPSAGFIDCAGIELIEVCPPVGQFGDDWRFRRGGCAGIYKFTAISYTKTHFF
jgi:hypothetical protein